MSSLSIFSFGPGGWGLALLEGAAMTLLVSACGLVIGGALGGGHLRRQGNGVQARAS